MSNNETEVEWAKAMLERVIAIGETLDPHERAGWESGLVARMQEIYAFQSERQWTGYIGRLVLRAVATARPLPTEKPPLATHNLSFGMEFAEALRDLDMGRDPPRPGESLEAVQRLGDFVASVANDLHLVARQAVFGEHEIPERFPHVYLKKIDERWPTHLIITLRRCADSWHQTLTQQMRGANGGKAPRRPQSPAAILVAAVLREQPRLRDNPCTFRTLVEALRARDVWDDVLIDQMTIAWERPWSGGVMVYLGGRELEPVTARALQEAFRRARKK